MFTQHTITNFENYAIGDLITTAGQSVTGLSSTAGAALYTDLPVSTEDVHKQATDLQAVQDKPAYHGKGDDSDAARLILQTSMHDNGVYVNTVAKGDLVKLAISGYPVSEPPQAIGPMAKGTLKASQAKQDGALSYEVTDVQHQRGFLIFCIEASNPETDIKKWPWYWSPNSKGTITQLQKSVKYKLSSVALGTDPTLTFSDVVTATTQG